MDPELGACACVTRSSVVLLRSPGADVRPDADHLRGTRRCARALQRNGMRNDGMPQRFNRQSLG